MQKKFNRTAIAALSTLSFAGCLADETPSDSEELQAVTASSDRTPAELEVSQRIQAAAAGNFHQIVNFAFANQCVDAPNGTLNVVLKLTTCNINSDSQKWSFVAASAPNTFFLVNKRSGFCAEVNNGTSTPGERVDQFHCNGTQAEQWIQSFRVVDGVSYQQYTHAGTSLCLDTVGSAGSQLMQFNCGASNDAQTWLVR
jgi:hypothetical protein